jgi:hypothetical protein
VRALPVNREALAVTEAAVAAEVHQALDVHLHFAAQIAFDLGGPCGDGGRGSSRGPSGA